MNNPVLALMTNDSEDAFVRDIAEAYFNNPAHVRQVLTEDCIESCLDAYMDAQTVELDMSDLPKNQDGFTKPSRANRGRKKSDKRNKKSRSDRFHGSRKSYWKHQYKKWSANERRQALDKNGFGALHASHRIKTKGAMPMPYVPDGESETRTFTYADGFILSMSMSKSTWEKEEKDDFSPSFNWDRKYTLEWDDNDDDWLDWEDEWDNDDDEIIGADCTQEQDTAEFSAMELADIVNQIAYATPDECVKIREFFRSL